MEKSLSGADYSNWSHEDLIARIADLERKLELYAGVSNFSPSNPPSSTDPRSHHETPQTAADGSPEIEANRKAPLASTLQDQSHESPRRSLRVADYSKYSTRYIALKFAYLGHQYNGLEHNNGTYTPLPTIEEELYKALRRTRLIFPPSPEAQRKAIRPDGDQCDWQRPYNVDWEGYQYSKCGRTDRGVSAFGQVIGIRVRSARPKKPPADPERHDGIGRAEEQTDVGCVAPEPANIELSETENAWDDVADELPYISMLNQMLPKDIRVLAWCPRPPADFDARFSCVQRQYRYFFTQPAFSPTPAPSGDVTKSSNRQTAPASREGWLDIDAMRRAAKYFEGTHDFRNFCKLDTSKQITNFIRRISYADIELVPEPFSYLNFPELRQYENSDNNSTTNMQGREQPLKIYTFTLHGSAFLWHQVRHMVAILFLIGQGLESPEMIPELLDVEKHPRRPIYEMADDAPLVLWDCVFPEKTGEGVEGLEWVYAGDPRLLKKKPKRAAGKFGVGGVVNDLWTVWRGRKIDELLSAALLDVVAKQGDRRALSTPGPEGARNSQRMFHGGNEARHGGKYIPLLQRSRLDTVEAKNAKYMAGKGGRRAKKNGQDPQGSPSGDVKQ